MRIENKGVNVKKVLFSKATSFFYLLIFLVFVYKSITLLPVWLSVKDKSETAEIDYQKKLEMTQQKEQSTADNQTDKGKERYEKEFFNKLDEGENLIVLYGDPKVKIANEQERKMFWWEVQKQNFYVWWRNLHILKY